MIIVASMTAQTVKTDQIRRADLPEWATVSEPLPIPESASGPVFIRRQDTEIHLSDQRQAQYLGYRVKILQSSALQLGNISIAWNPMSGAPVVHDIRLYRDGRAIDVLKDASFEVLRREDQLEAAKLDGMLTAVLRIPDLRVGDELEVDLTTFSSDPTLGRQQSGMLALPGGPAPGRYHMGLSWDPDHRPNLKVSGDLLSASVRGENMIDFRFDNPGLLSVPTDAPKRYQWQRVVEYSDFDDWAGLSAYFAPLFVKAAALAANSPVKREASLIAAAHTSPVERADAALKLVQQDVRYIYVGLSGGNLTPASADETWQRRYGDCKGKTALLLALLGELNIQAEPVLINSSGADDGLDQRLPMPQFFDHVLVRAHIDGKIYWLDGTLPPVASPSARPVFPANWALPLTSAGSQLEKLGWQPPTAPDEINLFEIDARAGFDQPAHIVSTEIVRGVKGLEKYFQLSAVAPAQLIEAFRQRAIGETWQEIDDVNWRYDQKAQASVLTISGTGAVRWDDDGGGARSVALPGGGFSPPERRARPKDSARDIPFYTESDYTCYVTTVRLPSSTQAKQWSAKPSFDNIVFGRHYHRAWELRDGAIRMIRGSRVDQTEIDVATAERDNARIATCDNSMGWISFNPSGQKASVGNGERVPATYEIDWTASDVPCLTTAKMPSIAKAADGQ